MSMETQPQNRPRIHTAAEDLVPRIFVRLMFGLVAVILVLVSFSVLTNRPLESTPPDAPVIAERAIILSGGASGAARIFDAQGSLIADLSPEKGGFVAGIERVIHRERSMAGVDPGLPLLLQLRAGNRLSLTDPHTGWSAELMGFGADNTRTFARLLGQP
ncbi:MAG: photosynthetic complex assembly protein PuhC [Pseudomonadota bacterium]